MDRVSFSPGATLLILLGLVVPEALRSSSKFLEPYPAVILPAGAGKITVKRGVLHLNRTTLMGERDGKWRALDAVEFMRPIAVQYFARIAARNFGLGQRKRHRKLSADELETTHWLQTRLKLQSCSTRRLRVVKERITVDLRSGKEVASHLEAKRIYELD